MQEKEKDAEQREVEDAKEAEAELKPE